MEDERACFLVLGMHRSGTSALAGMLAHRGLSAPETQMAAHPMNPKGFFESIPVRDLNNDILARCGSNWRDWRPLSFGWLADADGERLLRKAQDTLEAEFPAAKAIVLKDPRICRLLPFWRIVLERAGRHPLVVHTHRHPDEVSASLQGLYGLTPAFTRLVWLRHVLEAEAGSRGMTRVFTSYARLLASPEAELARLSVAFGWTFDDGASPEATHFLSSELRRHRAETGASWEGLASASWHAETLGVLERLSALPADVSAQQVDFDRLQRIRLAFDVASTAFGPAMDDKLLDGAVLRRAQKDLAACKAELDALKANRPAGS